MKISYQFAVSLFFLGSSLLATPIPSSIDEKALDRTTNPCNDFYQFACGNWIKTAELPTGYSNWTRSFSSIEEENLGTLKTLLEGFATGTVKHPVQNAGKLGDYYAACIDEQNAEGAAAKVLPAPLKKIETLADKDALASSLAEWHSKGVSALFDYSADQDYGDATQMIGIVDRGGMGLPDRDYYLSADPKMAKLRVLYAEHIARLLTLSGVSVADGQVYAARILEMETDLAKHSLSLAERRDPAKIYHPMTPEGLKKLTVSFPWALYFSAAGTPSLGRLNVTEPAYFENLNRLWNTTALADLKMYLRWQFLRLAAPRLGRAFEHESFAFYGKALSGKEALSPRWKRCVASTGAALGEALGEAYVNLNFGEKSKVETQALVRNILKTIGENFKTVEWMDPATRDAAVKKLEKIFSKIGYPDKWRDYSQLKIDRSSYLENDLRANVFNVHRNLAKIGKPVDRTEWAMSPQEVNAYYNPTLNEIVFPAAILQSPFYKVEYPLASNYGGIGMVIGHEITHAFDDEGRQFDEKGNLRNWWTPQVEKAFAERTQCLVNQYNQYTVSGGVHLNGKLTLGENIADLGGLKLSYNAFRSATQGQPVAEPVAGFTENQQFFVSFAQGWCTKGTSEWEQLMANTNPHSHPRFRVNGVVVNVPSFAEAFSCKTGTPMAPVDRCTIW